MERGYEGDLYKVLTVAEVPFVIRYGYYDPEMERGHCDPMPIFPDFQQKPRFTKEGYAFVTADQNECRHFKAKPRNSGEKWCNDCEHFLNGAELLGICLCEKNRKR